LSTGLLRDAAPVIPKCSELRWIGRSHKDFQGFPELLKERVLFDLLEAQLGRHPQTAKPLKGFGGASVLELSYSTPAGAYRTVYTVRIRGAICVLHCFQKKSGIGIKTSQKDLDIIKQRLAQAEEEYGR